MTTSKKSAKNKARTGKKTSKKTPKRSNVRTPRGNRGGYPDPVGSKNPGGG